MHDPTPTERRLATLRDHGVLDTAAHATLDDLTMLAREICGTPIALITLVDGTRPWFVSCRGIDFPETAREHSLCAHVLDGPDLLIVPDTRRDRRFADHPVVRGKPCVRSYAGAALVTPEGERIGALCVLDRRPRRFNAVQQHTLRVLSRHVVAQLELGRRLRAQQRSEQDQRELAARLEHQRARLVEAQAIAKVGSWETDLTTLDVVWSEETFRIFQTTPLAFRPTHAGFLALVHPDDRATVDAAFVASTGSREPCTIEHRVLLPDGAVKIVEERWQVFLGADGKAVRAIGTCRDITDQRRLEQERGQLVHNLGERVKELQALHQTADVLRQVERPLDEILARIVALIPPAMQYPEISAARVTFGTSEHATDNWRAAPRGLSSTFTTQSGVTGRLEIVYLEERPPAGEGPFLAEERKLIDSMAEMLRSTIDRRDAETVLREIQRRQRLILDSVSEGIHGIDRHGRIVFENAAGAAMLGWSANELVGHPSHALIHHHRADGTDYPVDACPIYRTLRDGVSRRIDDEVFFRRDGSSFPVEYSCAPIRSESGAISGAVICFRDISTRRESERFLARLRGLARMASRLARIGAWQLDLADGSMFWSDEVRALHEVDEAFVPSLERMFEFYTPETRPQVRAGFQRCILDGVPFDVEARVQSYRERQFWIRIIGEAVRDAEGLVICVQGAFQDIEESKRAAQDLSEARILHAGLVNSIDGIVWEADASTLTFNFVSDQAERILGYPVGAWRETPDFWANHIHPEEREEIVRRCRETSERREHHTLEYRMLKADGGIAWIRDIVTHVELSDRPAVLRGIMLDITDLKRIEAERKQLEARLTTTLEAITDAFFTLDATWGFTFLNREAERILQRPRTALLGRNLWTEFPAIRGSAIESNYRQAVENQASVSFEYHAEPTGNWFEVRAHPGEFGLAVSFRDITANRTAAEALRLSEERFRLLAQATNDAVWDWNLPADTVWWNEGYEQLFGHRREEADRSSRSWTDYLHPEDRDRVVAGIHAVIDGTAREWADEYRFRRRDGTYVHVADRGLVIRDRAGQGIRMIGGMTDLTERKRAEEKLREQAALLDQAKDAIIVRDLEHHVVYWNKSAVKFYGWTAAEVAGRSIKELIYRDPAQFMVATAHVLEHGEWTGEIEQVRRDGSLLTVDGSWTLLRDERGAPKSILAINTDITERKMLEQQFLRAQRMESIGTLAGGVAHDLNNILAPIVMGIELLQHFGPSPAARPVLENIGRAARRGSDLVRQVLSFARGVEGLRIEIDLHDIVREIQSIVANSFPKNIVFQADLPESLWAIAGDPTQINQVCLNLCVNARDAMPQGGTLTIAAENVEIDEQFAVMNRGANPGPHVMLGVSDTGGGMPRELVERIFEPFFTTKEIGKGSGLGLSTVLGIVRSHHGFIQVDSEPGKGSTFRVYLPASTGKAAASRDVPRAETPPRGNGELILVVDDEASIRDITKQTLETYGYRVLTAEDGAKALVQFAQVRGEVAVIFCDMMMPVMDGPTFIVALRHLDAGVPIIAASGLDTSVQMARATGLGVKRFLPKPYTAESLLDALRQTLSELRVDPKS